MQIKPYSVYNTDKFAKCTYVCAPATSSYKWKWCCYIEIVKTEISNEQKVQAVEKAKTWLGKWYPADSWELFFGTNKYDENDKFYCSKLVFLAYYRVSDCNLSTWYERSPSPLSIYRDDECWVLSDELKDENWYK